MTDDLEMTKLCAEAMGLVDLTEDSQRVYERIQHPHCEYDPLHDDAQAMALVKRLELSITNPVRLNGDAWVVFRVDAESVLGTPPEVEGKSTDLNRAIVECVAKMQAATVQPKPPS